MALPAKETVNQSLADTSLRSSGRAFVLCLSFANLCFLRTWADLQDHDASFFNTWAPGWTHLAAVTLDVLLLAILLWVPAVLVVRSGKRSWVRVLKWSILACLVVPINSIRMDPYIVRRSGEILQARNGRLLLGIAGVLLTGLLLIRWERLSARVVSALLTMLVPAFPLLVLTTAKSIHDGPSGILRNRPLLAALPQKPGAPRVVWVIFDEWDQPLTFNSRPACLRLPELDRFRSESLHTDHAYPPARFTIISVPSLLAGRTFVRSVRNGASEMLLTAVPGLPPEPVSAQQTIFREARTAGFNVGVAGWYLPYFRLFGDLTAGPREDADGAGFSLTALMLEAAREHMHDIPFATRFGLVKTIGVIGAEEHIRVYAKLRQDALRLILDRRLNLVFLHMNVPHPQFIFNASRNSFSTTGGTYLENIALVDRFLGEIRRAMEQAGIWNETTVLLSSDHPLRLNMYPADTQTVNGVRLQQSHQVPFLLKMAGQQRGLDYQRAIQTVVTKDLLLDVLDQKVKTADEVAGWLDSHAPRQ